MSSRLNLCASAFLCLAIWGSGPARAAEPKGQAGLWNAPATPVDARPALSPAAGLRVATPTIHSIGFEWDMEGDSNHNATCKVRYRKAGADAWRDALPLLRVDYQGWYGPDNDAYRHFNMFAGSLMFLDPATAYEVELTAADPDGGQATRTLTVKTLPVPALPLDARARHVVPGNGGGDGSEQQPFQGLAEAEKHAQPGDLFLLHKGVYENPVTATVSGEPGRYIAWKPAGDGEVLFHSAVNIAANWRWFEGLTFEFVDWVPDFASKSYEERKALHSAAKEDKALRAKMEVGFRNYAKNTGYHDVVITRNTFRNCPWSLMTREVVWDGNPAALSRRWYIADNVSLGGPRCEYFARIYLLADSDISFNRLSTSYNFRGGDAISVRFSSNLDIHHNDIRECDDDALEPDSSYANIRIWCNRVISPKWQFVSMQPMLCGPWYLVRNEVVLDYDPKRRSTPIKANVFDRFVLVNNTFYIRGAQGQNKADVLLRSFSRNNLWVFLFAPPPGQEGAEALMWEGYGDGNASTQYLIAGQSAPRWNSDVDYDGFAWDRSATRTWAVFLWRDAQRQAHRYADLASFSKALGIESHGVQLPMDGVFEITDVPAYGREPWSPKRLTLKANSKAIDAGQPVPNLSETFTGQAPDLGACEFGAPPMPYGPR